MSNNKGRPLKQCCECHRRIRTRNVCGSCSSKKWRLSHPIEYAYYNLKNRAKQRISKQWPNGIPFTITLEEFKKFCYETEYIQNKGKTSTSHSVDRDNEELGYVAGNLKSIPLGDNVRKSNKKRCSWNGPNTFTAATVHELTDEEKYF
jgi:hypothetical protein